MFKVFLDGSSGTCGLRIKERLEERDDIELLIPEESEKKDPEVKKRFLKAADLVFLCLPDEAARETVKLAEDLDTVIIDTSTAHRTHPSWTYGFPELTGKREQIRNSKRIANPGCHAGGFISLVAPLTETGILKRDRVISCFSITGYSGGGKKMIAEYGAEERSKLLDAPRMYGLSQTHKHLPEMAKYCGLYYDPLFCPVVSDFYSGMEVVVYLTKDDIKGTVSDVKDVLGSYYSGSKVVIYTESDDGDGMLSAGKMSGTDSMEIGVYGNKDRITLVSRFDNLGKGASGAAIQNMNIVMGTDETKGLVIYGGQ